MKEVINESKRLIGEIIDNYEADAINLPSEMYNELKYNYKQLKKHSLSPAAEPLTVEPMTAEEILDDTMRCTISDDDDLDNPENFYFKYNDVLEAMRRYASKPTVAEREVSEECEHPYAYVYRKGDYESCTKCGKELCNG